jgi:hypothetical protein
MTVECPKREKAYTIPTLSKTELQRENTTIQKHVIQPVEMIENKGVTDYHGLRCTT